MSDADEVLEHFGVKGQKWGIRKQEPVSTKPWSSYKESDYTLTQWHNACLIHQHSGTPTSKASCKLPVKTPDGVVNVNGVHAAAAALGGARHALNASPEEKAKAKKQLISLYNQLDQPLPPSLKHSTADDILAHVGVKGMKWGVRKQSRPSADAKEVATLKKKPIHSLTNKELQTANTRMNLEQNFRRMNPTKLERIQKGAKQAEKVLAIVGVELTVQKMIRSDRGKKYIEQGMNFLKKKPKSSLRAPKEYLSLLSK